MKLRLLALASCAAATACSTTVPLGEHLGSGGGNQTAGGGSCTGGAGGGSPVMLATGYDPFGLVLYGGNLYWSDSLATMPEDAIVRLPVFGGTPVTLTESLNTAVDVAVGPTGVYFTGDLTDVMNVSLAGGAATAIVSGTNVQTGNVALALDATNVYWTGLDGLVKAPLQGGTQVTLAAAARTTPIAVHDGLIYWAQDGSLWSVPVDGGTQSDVWTLSATDAITTVGGLAFDSSAVYGTFVGSSGTYVIKVPLDGGAAVTLASTPVLGLSFDIIAVDGANVYYAFHDWSPMTQGVKNLCGALMRVPIEGGTPVTLAAGVPVSGIALDCENVYWSQTGQCPDGTKVASGIFKLPKP